MNPKNNTLFYILLLVIVVVSSAAAGYFLLRPKTASTALEQTTSPDKNGYSGGFSQDRQGGRGNFKPLHGTISSINTNSGTIMMKADDGSTKNISISSDTRISKMDNSQRQELAITDLSAGEEINVMASDTTQTDITPRMIVIGTFTPPSRGSYQGNDGLNNNTQPDNSSTAI